MSAANVQGADEILSNNQTELAMIILMLVITPAISAIGIVGNVCSILVLAKQNFRKCSNILLLGLAITDIMFLIGFNSVPKIVYTVWGKQTFPFSYYASEVLFICFELFLVIDYSSGYISITIPMLITIERLITIFLPLQVSQIITPKRTLFSVSCVFIFWYVNIIYTVFWFSLSDKHNFQENRTGYVIVRSPLFVHDKAAVFTIEEVWTYLSMRIPPVFTFLGSVVIGAKLKMTLAKRRRLTGNNSQRSMLQTTKTLLAVCMMYMITCLVISLPVIIPQYVSYLLTEEDVSNISLVVYQLINIVPCINCSCNFIIYILFNKKFSQAYKALFIKDKKKTNVAVALIKNIMNCTTKN